MRQRTLIVWVTAICLLAVSCTAESDVPVDRVKPVRVRELKTETHPKTMEYIGMVSADEVKKLSFKSPGKIGSISVQRGDSIKKGDVLAQLDEQDLQFALEAAQAQKEAAQAQYQKALNGASKEEIRISDINLSKAQAAYDFAKEYYRKAEALYEQGGINANDLDKAKLEMDISKADLDQAKEVNAQVKNGADQEDIAALYNQLKAAEIDVEQKESMVESASIEADMDGYVIDILFNVGEMVSAGYPVIVIRGTGETVEVGVSQDDIAQIQRGMKANIKMGEIEKTGVISDIGQVPEEQTRTYPVQIELEDDSFKLGSIVKAEIIIGEDAGIWIPISSIISDGGDDYVFAAVNNHAEKRKITIIDTQGNLAEVEGVAAGDALVVEGTLKLRDGDKVDMIEQGVDS